MIRVTNYCHSEKPSTHQQKHGNCDVPRKRSDDEYDVLYKWVCRVRKEHKALQENGESSFLDNQRVEVLKEMGFSWAGRPGPAKGTRKATRLIDESWDEMVEELTKFKQKYGHCDVPRNSEDEEYTALYKWVCGVRKEHKALPEQHPSFP